MRKQSLGGYGKVWDREIDEFEQMQNIVIPKKDEMLQTIIEMIPFNTAAHLKILEIGGGTGALTKKVLSVFTNVSYIFSDASDGMVRTSAEKFGRGDDSIRFVVADFNRAGWYDKLGKQKVDLILSSLCFHYVATKRREGFFCELAKILKKGGILIYAAAVKSPHKLIQKRIENNHRIFLKVQFKEIMGMELTDEDFDRIYRERQLTLGVNPMSSKENLEMLEKARFSNAELIWRFRHYGIFMARR